MYRRVPPVFSLEYLRVFLRTIEKEGYDRKVVREAIFNERVRLEKEKFKAIGRGHRLRKTKSEALAKNCYQLSMQIGFLKRLNDDIVLTEDARAFISDHASSETRKMMLARLLETYDPFNLILACLREQSAREILMPLSKDAKSRDLYKSTASQYGLSLNQVQFEVVRDLFTQLGIFNWREKMNVNRMQLLYLISRIFKLSEVTNRDEKTNEQFLKEIFGQTDTPLKMTAAEIADKAEKQGYTAIKMENSGEIFFVMGTTVDNSVFEEVLWKEYLKMSDYKSRYPVYYSELRDNVCEKLRISDVTFDDRIKRMINKPHEYTVKLYPAGGPMPPRRGLSSMLKVLPPRTGSDEYITFIKASR
jgi:hypothetical protein